MQVNKWLGLAVNSCCVYLHALLSITIINKPAPLTLSINTSAGLIKGYSPSYLLQTS